MKKINLGFIFAYCAWQRLWAMVRKEFIQMKRDRGTFGMIVGIPLIQVIIFGLAINNDPKHLSTALVSSDNSAFTRSYIQRLENTGYFRIDHYTQNEKEAARWLATGKVQFVLHIPPDFTRQLIHGERPALLLETDATDPVATGNAIAASNILTSFVFDDLLVGSLSSLKATPPPFELHIQPRYNPAGITQYNIVPGLLGVVVTMTMVMITSAAITREHEKGTMENLLATPLQPLEVMLGKVTPYIIVGYIQITLILLFSFLLFQVPIHGSLFTLYLCSFPFILANLTVGVTLSTIAQNQLQAVQMSTFFFLPSILLSGFMFPFKGMPLWAQVIGETLPLTHFLRISRGVLLKGNGWLKIWPDIWPICLFLLVTLAIGAKRYRRTLD